jgi:TRAP-type C4-dicarboxylate transport system permease small subunit
MDRSVFLALALAAAALVAILFANVASDLGIAIDTIRTDALASACFLCVVVVGTFPKRNR